MFKFWFNTITTIKNKNNIWITCRIIVKSEKKPNKYCGYKKENDINVENIWVLYLNTEGWSSSDTNIDAPVLHNTFTTRSFLSDT